MIRKLLNRTISRRFYSIYDRPIGIEMEMVVKKGYVIKDMCHLSNYFNTNGFKVKMDNFRNKDKEYVSWVLSKDVTINETDGYNFGVEIKTPKLTLKDVEKDLPIVEKILNSVDTYCNHSCGLHVHMDMSDLNSLEKTYFVLNYAHFEKIIDTFMDESRRESNNRHCRSNRYLIHNQTSIDSLLMLARSNVERGEQDTPGYLGKPYKVNTKGVHNEGGYTTEVRHHHGTIDSERIIKWCKFLLKLLEKSKSTLLELEPRCKDPEYLWVFLDDDDLKEYFTNIKKN